MAIQIPNPGTGNGATGDNEFVLWSKVKDNFSNTSHAASRLVGESNNNVMQVGAFGLGKPLVGDKRLNITTSDEIVAELQKNGGQFFANDAGADTDITLRNGAGIFSGVRDTYGGITMSYASPKIRVFGGHTTRAGGAWACDLYHDKSTVIYGVTTAAGANVVVNSTGQLTRASSSERYKDIIANLELDDEHYADAMSLNPIIYRSKSEIDNPNYHYYSFSAEALGAYDPAFTLWRDTETITDDEGNTSEQPLDERVAEGINLNAIVAFLHATNVKQGKLIDELSARIGVLEDANK